MSISEELHEIAVFARECGIGSVSRRIGIVTDRIGAEMIELPKGEDGKPIHCGEELWVDCADSYEKRHLLCMRLDGSGTWALMFNGGTMCDPSIVTHECPDSLERIADELEDLSEDNRVNGDTEVFARAADLAERIRKLAEGKEGA
nr:MAG TPA: hypothetical protein [Caudoviricetes sp.]